MTEPSTYSQLQGDCTHRLDRRPSTLDSCDTSCSLSSLPNMCCRCHSHCYHNHHWACPPCGYPILYLDQGTAQRRTGASPPANSAPPQAPVQTQTFVITTPIQAQLQLSTPVLATPPMLAPINLVPTPAQGPVTAQLASVALQSPVQAAVPIQSSVPTSIYVTPPIVSVALPSN